MAYLGVFDLFRIGIGPSSSHTVGPMRAARRFLAELPPTVFERIDRVAVTVHGSLAHTGSGHATDRALILGLTGEAPDTVDVDRVPVLVERVAAAGRLSLLGRRTVAFDPDRDLVLDRVERLPLHSNGMRFRAWDGAGHLMAERVLYSPGGGFVVDEDEALADGLAPGAGERARGAHEGRAESGPDAVPWPFATMTGLLAHGRATGMPIVRLLLANECALRPDAEVRAWLDRIRSTMHACIDRGLATDGELPGGLRVRRRARAIAERLRSGEADAARAGLRAMQWVNAWALAVNEENAAGGRVVTAPTNGAAGIVPAVLRYLERGCGGDTDAQRTLLIVAAAVGSLCKRNASISGAEVGCQGEVGSASSMAAGGLAAALGGSDAQVENAAEIALEHHLGMTCDPIGGLVQIPCIERNAMGAVKAINAAMLALAGDGSHRVSLDAAIDTMRRTGADMQSMYKETSLGGLALSQPEC